MFATTALLFAAASTAASATASTTPATGLTYAVFNNTALAGVPKQNSTTPTPSAQHDACAPFSATLTGMLAVERGFLYNFSCSFGGAALGYLHIDGHLVCQMGTNYDHPPAGASVRSVAYDMPLPVLSNTNLPVRFAIVHNGSCSSDAEQLAFGVDITRVQAASSGDERTNNASAVEDADTDWLAAALSPKLSAAEMKVVSARALPSQAL